MYSPVIDIEVLPQEIRNQLIDYYTFLVDKYGNQPKKSSVKPTFSESDIQELGEITLTEDPMSFQKKMRDIE